MGRELSAMAWDRGARLLTLVLGVALALLLAGPAPAQASIGGSAESIGLSATAPQLELDVQASGAIGAIQPVVNYLTRDPIIDGGSQIAAQAHTPPSPEGSDSDQTPERSIPAVVTVSQIDAATDRQQDGDLTATASTGPVDVSVLGFDVINVGEVSARSTTHPTDDPSAQSQAPDVVVLGNNVTLPADEPLDIDEDISTADALALLEEAFPGLRGVVEMVGGVFEAGGGFSVQVGRTAQADAATGAAQATGFYANVALDLDVRICIPRGDDCFAELRVRTDAQVLDLVLAQTSVERPEATPIVERIPWATVIPLVLSAIGIAVLIGVLVSRRRRTEPTPAQPQPAQCPPAAQSPPPGHSAPPSSGGSP